MHDLLEYLRQIDTDLLVWINGNHNNFFDFLMYWFSNRPIWIPLYLFLIILIFRVYGKKSWWLMLGVALMIILSDQVSVHLFKNMFQRLRPCHEPSLQGVLHLVKGECGGTYGFLSSHAANTFALAVFLFGFLKEKFPGLAWALVFWAAIISYSRIYLGVHYPGDVMAGILLGIIFGRAFRNFTLGCINIRKSGS